MHVMRKGWHFIWPLLRKPVDTWPYTLVHNSELTKGTRLLMFDHEARRYGIDYRNSLWDIVEDPAPDPDVDGGVLVRAVSNRGDKHTLQLDDIRQFVYNGPSDQQVKQARKLLKKQRR